MNYFCYLLFYLLFPLSRHTQNCKALHKKTLFTNLKFGDPIPDGLITCSKSVKVAYSHYTSLRVEYDSLKQSCKRKYADLLTFSSVPFSFLQLGANKKGKIFSIE